MRSYEVYCVVSHSHRWSSSAPTSDRIENQSPNQSALEWEFLFRRPTHPKMIIDCRPKWIIWRNTIFIPNRVGGHGRWWTHDEEVVQPLERKKQFGSIEVFCCFTASQTFDLSPQRDDRRGRRRRRRIKEAERDRSFRRDLERSVFWFTWSHVWMIPLCNMLPFTSFCYSNSSSKETQWTVRHGKKFFCRLAFCNHFLSPSGLCFSTPPPQLFWLLCESNDPAKKQTQTPQPGFLERWK